jgi:gliding motility-associated-like protein
MKQTFKFILAMAWLLAGGRAIAQNLSNKGREFWVGYGHHQFMESGTNTQEMVLYLSAEQPAHVVVTIDSSDRDIFTPLYKRIYDIPANTVISTETTIPQPGSTPTPIVAGAIPKTSPYDARLYDVPFPLGNGGDGLFRRKGIHIVSDVPIVAYAHIYGSASSGATMLMPVETWGYSYTAINSKQYYANNCFSWVYVIAQHDSTKIEITPSADTRTGKPAGVPFTAMLMKGHIYQVVGANPTNGSTANEMTGTKIKSIDNGRGVCYPIAVFCGSSRTTNPASCGSGGGDNDNQQMFPDQAWGKRYLTAPLSSSTAASTLMTSHIYKIAVKDPTTIVKRNGVPLTGLVNNVYTYESGTADYIESDKPITVAQFITGGGCLNGGVGDPEMIYLSPLEQGINRVAFYRNNREAITVNYLTLIIPTAGVSSLRIDGSAAFDYSYPHPNLAGYTVVVKRWTASQAQSTAISDSAFTAVTYGLGSVESYGYNAGTLINNLAATSSLHNTGDTAVNAVHPYTCKGTPVEVSMWVRYKPTKIVWAFSQLGTVVSPNADITDLSPVAVDSVFKLGQWYYKIKCPVLHTFDSGTWFLPVRNTHPTIENCYNTEEVKLDIVVKAAPKINFNYSFLNCSDTVNFTTDTLALNNYVVKRFKWFFPAGTLPYDTSILQNPQALMPPTGPYSIHFQAYSKEGCIGDTTKIIVPPGGANAEFKIDPSPVCAGTPVAITDTSNAIGASGTFFWDFGNGSPTVTTGTNTVQNVTYNNYGTYIIKHLVSTASACPVDTVKRTLIVYAKPNPNFTFPVGCLPANGVVTFNNTSTVADGQPFNPASYAWNFGDPNANAGNPNTSTLFSPSHTYTAVGTYNVNLSLSTVNGCTKDTTIAATFNIRPVLSYPALPSICESSAPVSVATASVTNAVPGSGVYSGPGTNPAGLFNPAVAGPGLHTIKYIFTSTGGCVDSITQNILVYAKPYAAFTAPPSGCIPASGLVQFTNASTVSDAQTMTYSWNFGDPNATVSNPNTSTATSPTHNYSNVGTYNITLTATTNNGCVDDTIWTVQWGVKPILSYPALPTVCESAATLSVATATVTNGVAGTGVYSGAGTDAAGNFNPAIAGAGTHVIKYVFTSTVGCADSITQTILVRAKPLASFTAPAAGCIPSTGLVSFTNNSSISDGQTMTYSWNFGDPNATVSNPNTSTATNPSHNYSDYGTYTIVLTATTNNGCVDDSSFTVTYGVKPTLAYPALTAVCQSAAPVSVATATVTNGVSGTGVYSGPGTDAAGNFNPAIAGAGTHVIKYVFTSTVGCADSITQTILVRAKPLASFTAPAAGCIPSTGLVSFTNNSSISDGQTMTYSWNFGDPNATVSNPNTSTATNPSHNYSDYGTYTIVLTATTNNGCVDDSSFTVTYGVKPTLAYPALTAVCQSAAPVSVATATVTNGVSGSGVYSGPGTDAAGNFNPATAGAGTHVIKYVFTSTGGCKDSITQTILVRAKPLASFTAPAAGCIPSTGLVSFMNNSSISDAQTMTYSWNFGDPNATVSNPNTSTATNPSHNYSDYGTYTIVLTATTNNGCVDDSTLIVSYGVKPTLAYPALTAVCQSAAPVSVATATVTNGVSGTGVYSGPGTDAAGNFNPAIAGAGIHTIKYTFTSTGGCIDSIKQTILVHPKPVSSFSVTADICLNQSATITDNSTISSGTITTWNWNFGNSTTASNNNGNSFTQSYTNDGNYTITLVTVSDKLCESDPFSQIVKVHPMPVAKFEMPASVCMPNGTVTLTNTSTVSDNSTLTSMWDFGDASATFNGTDASHVYAAIGTYPIKLTVTSAYGCSDDTTRNFSAFYDKPVALFTVTPDELCQGKENLFKDLSTAPNSTIAIRSWDFGDGPAVLGTGADILKKFAQPGTYNVKLTVTNAVGCVSDPYPKTVKVYLQPVVDAGRSFVVRQGSIITFEPSANDSSSNISFTWTPSFDFVNPHVLRPTLVANRTQLYTLTAVGEGNCTASDTLLVKILLPVKVPNAFSPNGDGVNDRWEIPNLADYPNCRVQVFNRYGQVVYNSNGYSAPWDGTMKGKPLPLATYYYIIDLNSGFQPLQGSVTIVR